ncbi:BZ3500_MvSof-1268-A1-R1_C101g00559 [Microbotryum saponariae]|uniref:BZ3500_MvSof-1268-A1-R1_C101g00559 protein n=1 Tax=Microbotryum saponariae TaxID=289078 RepID=A0A2X0LLD4_9BASI|nr:BZ3500_MvSof-1268-A1-R1_C101g00559 [Microbotryum saponariae]
MIESTRAAPSIAPSHHGQLSRLAFGPQDPSSPESSIGEQIATLQAQLAALQARNPPPPQPPPPAVTVVPGNAATASKVVFPKHARLDGPKSFTNWLRQLRLALPNQVLLAARDDAAREIIVGSIDSADVSATLDAIPSDDFVRSPLDFRKMPASVEAYDTWLREYMSIAQEIRDAKTSLNDVLATHVLAMVPSCLDSFRLTFTDEQRNRRDLPELTTLTDRIRIQLRSAGLSTSHSAMLATIPLPRLPRSRSPPARLHFTCEAPPTGPCRRCHKKGHWALDCKNRGEQARSSDDTQDDTSSSAASQPNVGYFASCLFARRQLPTDAFVVDSDGTHQDRRHRGRHHGYRHGDVAFVAKTGHPITLRGVLHTPGLHVNLLSRRHRHRQDGRAIAHGTRVNDGLYLLDADHTKCQHLAFLSRSESPVPLLTLHCLAILPILYTEDDCCRFAGRVWAGYSDKDVEELGLVHSDVLSFPTPSLTGKRYLVTFLDDHSRKLWAYAIDHKSDVFPTFQTWLAEWRHSSSILYPYTPQQNGRAERSISIVEGVLALLRTPVCRPPFGMKRLRISFIEKQVLTLSFGQTDSRIRLERPTHPPRPPPVRLHSLAHGRPDLRSKLDPKAARVIFTGYDLASKAFRFFDHSINKIVLGRNATFLDDDFPGLPVTTPVDADTRPSVRRSRRHAPAVKTRTH